MNASADRNALPASPDPGRPTLTTQHQPAGPIAVETISSYARRVGDRVRVVLDLPDLDTREQTEMEVRLKSPHGTAVSRGRTSTSAAGTRLEVEFPGRRLRPGIWRLAARPAPDAPYRRLGARLLTSRTQPIALLVGGAPRGSIDPPTPRRTLTRKQRLAHRAGTLVDQALSPFPAEKADRYRAAARRTARKLLR